MCESGAIGEFLDEASSENSCPNVRISYGSAQQVSSLLCKLNAADRYRRRFKSLEPEHRPNPLFDAAILVSALVELRNKALYPVQNRLVRERNSALRHHLDQVPRAQFVSEIPAHAKHNDFRVEMPSPKQNPMLSSSTTIAVPLNRHHGLHQNRMGEPQVSLNIVEELLKGS